MVVWFCAARSAARSAAGFGARRDMMAAGEALWQRAGWRVEMSGGLRTCWRMSCSGIELL